ncbi:caseinolytic peptidase B protein [Acrasis kona]|uniref:Caseinolytic peptidase B protein n=1 Tax=Acrasis kona TaxID=1008807 RepID=A0AAW2Z677_9EUKA
MNNKEKPSTADAKDNPKEDRTSPKNKPTAFNTLTSYITSAAAVVKNQLSPATSTRPKTKQKETLSRTEVTEIKDEPFEIVYFKRSLGEADAPLTGIRLEAFLRSMLIDQHLAIKTLCYALIRQSTIWNYQQGARGPTAVPSCFLFVGPGGVGKIYLSKCLAQAQKRPFVYFDMKLFKKQSSKFINDHDQLDRKNQQPGQLNVVLKRAPNAVIVLNHIELADAKIFSTLFELFQQGAIYKTLTSVTSKKDAPVTTTTTTIPILDASRCVFICMTDISDEVVKEFISTTTTKPVQSHPEHIQPPHQSVQYRNEEQPPSHKQASPLTEERRNLNRRPIARRIQKQEPLTIDPTSLMLHDDNEQTMDDALDSIVEFRYKITPILSDHLNQSNTAKCHDAFIERFNAIVPFFEFDGIRLKTSILNELNTFRRITENNVRSLRLTWSEDVVIWLMKRYRPTLSIQGLLENHILTQLAACDLLFKIGDHIHLSVDVDQDKVSIQVLNRRNEEQVKQNIEQVRSKL